MANVLIVAVAIVDSLAKPTRVLCAQRSAPASLDGYWEFPGGKVEPGESPVAALRREIREEVGVTLTLGQEFPRPDGSDWPLPNGQDMRLWLGLVDDGVPAPLQDHHELRWVDVDQLHELPWLEGDIPIVRLLQERYE